MERIYPAYGDKIRGNSDKVIADPRAFAETLNLEYAKAIKSKAKDYDGLEKLPVRIYGSGDYIKEHLAVLQHLNFKFFLISKTLTEAAFQEDLDEILKIPNCTSVVLSFDTHNIARTYKVVESRFKQPYIKFSYTGTVDDILVERDFLNRKFNIFFNIGNKKSEKEASKAIKWRCPADSGELALKKACTVCHKCWKSDRF